MQKRWNTWRKVSRYLFPCCLNHFLPGYPHFSFISASCVVTGCGNFSDRTRSHGNSLFSFSQYNKHLTRLSFDVPHTTATIQFLQWNAEGLVFHKLVIYSYSEKQSYWLSFLYVFMRARCEAPRSFDICRRRPPETSYITNYGNRLFLRLEPVRRTSGGWGRFFFLYGDFENTHHRTGPHITTYLGHVKEWWRAPRRRGYSLILP